MSRRKDSNDILTKEKHVRVGKRVMAHGEPHVLVGPEKNKDLFSIQDMAEQLYGPGTKCYVEPPLVGNKS